MLIIQIMKLLSRTILNYTGETFILKLKVPPYTNMLHRAAIMGLK